MITNIKLFGTENDKGAYEYIKNEGKYKYIFNYPWLNDFVQCKPYKIDISPGKYLFELWGAQGGNSNCPSRCHDKKQFGGYGGYSQSVYNIKATTTLFLYIGAQPNVNTFGTFAEGGYNGGGRSGIYGGGGGGATDVRLVGGEWNESFEQRLIVAGGGGGDRIYIEGSHRGGDGGGLDGGGGIGNQNCYSCFGSTLTENCEFDHPNPSTCLINLGIKGIGASNTSKHDGGGAGGYIGGGTSYASSGGGGGQVI